MLKIALAAACSCLWLLLAAVPARADTPIDLASIKPFCSHALFEYDTPSGTCKLKAAAPADQASCLAPVFKFETGACTVSKAPAPQCGNALPDLAFRDKACVVERRTQRSASADYMGDCFRITALPGNGRSIGYPSGTAVKVLSQKPLGEDDKELTVAQADGTGMFTCRASRNSTTATLNASELVAIGASRVGWTYGVLTMPFKYYAHDKSLESGVSIGPYFGRRWGTPGSAYTFAAAATVGSVKGEVRDAQGNIASTPDLQALSVATGFMWDISKSPNVKPFKIGLFVGTDVVSSDATVTYVHNRKPWVAFQVGFDFTDN
jgi:hypothetical protein